MGTNYYAVKSKPSCAEPIHIGKSSIGWLFRFQEQDDPWLEIPIEWHTYNQVKTWLKKYTVDNPIYTIVNEYDEIIPFDDFVALVDAKQADEDCRSNPNNFEYCKNVDGYRFSDEEFW